MDISVHKFDTICRICLLENGDMKSLFSKMDGDHRNLYEILAFTVDINVRFEDILPKQVCGECESVLYKAYAFKRRYLNSETILNNAYQKSLSKRKTSKCSIKDENEDTTHKLSSFKGNFESTNVIILGTQPNSEKNVLDNTTMHPLADSSFCQLTDSNVPLINVEAIKEEVSVGFGEEHDYPDNDLEPTLVEYKKENSVKLEETTQTCYCGLTFTCKDTYQSHLKNEQCDKCKETIKNKIVVTKKSASNNYYKKLKTNNDNKLQQKTVTNDKPLFYICKICLCQFKTRATLACHIRKHETSNNKTELYQCSLCLRNFKSKTSLSTHIKRHEVTDNIKHTCKVCKREFKYKAYLENHISTMHSKKSAMNCDVSGETFPNVESVETHKDSHTNEKKHRCTICNKAFLMSCTLKEHLRTHTGEKPFLCSQCGRGFSQKTNLAQHMRRHQGLKPFKCENCEKRFVSKGELDAHNRKHSGAHPFVCDDCGNGFTTSSALVKHRRIHTGEKPYLCDICPMKFAASGTLKNHKRTHTGERPFQCSYCEKAFVQRNDLISHIRCHTGEKPYECSYCGQSFRKASSQKTHMKMHVKEPVSLLQGVGAMMQCSKQ